jgi:hypothetical protein
MSPMLRDIGGSLSDGAASGLALSTSGTPPGVCAGPAEGKIPSLVLGNVEVSLAGAAAAGLGDTAVSALIAVGALEGAGAPISCTEGESYKATSITWRNQQSGCKN